MSSLTSLQYLQFLGVTIQELLSVRESNRKVGLHTPDWGQSFNHWPDLALNLMNLKPHKRLHFQRGLHHAYPSSKAPYSLVVIQIPHDAAASPQRMKGRITEVALDGGRKETGEQEPEYQSDRGH